MSTKRSSTSMRVVIIAAIVGSLALLVPTVGASVGPDTPNITVEQRETGSGGNCLPAAFVMSNKVINTDESFTLVVTVKSKLCQQIKASAVIYRMPDGGRAWPQTLSEKVEFTLLQPSVTTIRFKKGCEPVQFDVVTGQTPGRIDIGSSSYHGPLLFPLDLGTSLQWFGDPSCRPTTTTASTSSTTPTSTPASTPTSTPTSTPSSSPSSIPSDVAGETTLPGASQNPANANNTQQGSAPEQVAGINESSQAAALAVAG